LRLAFVLGNLTTNHDHIRYCLAFEGEGFATLCHLVSHYWKLDNGQTELNKASSPEDKDTEKVLEKLVRLIANVAINHEAGARLASAADIVEPLLSILEHKSMPASEELVLNTTAAITNLLFYDTEDNLLFSEANRQRLCRLLRPLLLESYNVEALIEAGRALGNLSRLPDARAWMFEFRIDEILSILLAHDDRDLVFYVCGALVNLAAEPACAERLLQGGVRSKLAAVLKDSQSDDPELQFCVVKVLSNLHLGMDVSTTWADDERVSVCEGLRQILNGQGEHREAESQLYELASGLLDGICA